MERWPVVSSTLRSAGYDAATRTLELEFTSDRIYRYFNVPPDIFAALMSVPSKGYFYNVAIRDFYPRAEVVEGRLGTVKYP
mgnify:FL=1